MSLAAPGLRMLIKPERIEPGRMVRVMSGPLQGLEAPLVKRRGEKITLATKLRDERSGQVTFRCDEKSVVRI